MHILFVEKVVLFHHSYNQVKLHNYLCIEYFLFAETSTFMCKVKESSDGCKVLCTLGNLYLSVQIDLAASKI